VINYFYNVVYANPGSAQTNSDRFNLTASIGVDFLYHAIVTCCDGEVCD